jgi:hypothetical protein
MEVQNSVFQIVIINTGLQNISEMVIAADYLCVVLL